MKKKQFYQKLVDNREYIPFENSEEAWLWCCLCESLGNQRAKGSSGRIARPCESSDIILSVKKLVQAGQLNQNHLKVLSKYGLLQIPPHENFGQPPRECSLWREGLKLLENILRLKGIVA